MEEDCKALTTFTVRPLRFYECERMPFGLTNAPAPFQHLIQSCLSNLHLQYCVIYLRAVFEQLKKAELRLKASKHQFFKHELANLSHVVSKNVSKLIPKR